MKPLTRFPDPDTIFAKILIHISYCYFQVFMTISDRAASFQHMSQIRRLHYQAKNKFFLKNFSSPLS